MTMTLERETPESVRLDLPFSAESAGVARGRLHEWLDNVEVAPDTRDDARLLISELIGNSVRHATPLDDEVLRVEWRVDGAADPRSTLEITVTDGGSATVPQVVDAEDGDQCGRGMAIVECLAIRWWVETERGTVTVHAEIDLP